MSGCATGNGGGPVMTDLIRSAPEHSTLPVEFPAIGHLSIPWHSLRSSLSPLRLLSLTYEQRKARQIRPSAVVHHLQVLHIHAGPITARLSMQIRRPSSNRPYSSCSFSPIQSTSMFTSSVSLRKHPPRKSQ